jgi:hypothetical protein
MLTLDEVLDRSLAEKRPTHEVANEMAKARSAWRRSRRRRRRLDVSGFDAEVEARPKSATRQPALAVRQG